MSPILILDDNALFRIALTRLFRLLGISPLVAKDCRTAFRLIQEHSPRLLILNLGMNEREGIEALLKVLPANVCMIYHCPGGTWPAHFPVPESAGPLLTTHELTKVLLSASFLQGSGSPEERVRLLLDQAPLGFTDFRT